MASEPAPPAPLAIVFAALAATLTVLIVPVPSTAPLVSVTVGLTATELVLANRAVAPLTVMPLLLLIAPLPPTINAPAETLVGPL